MYWQSGSSCDSFGRLFGPRRQVVESNTRVSSVPSSHKDNTLCSPGGPECAPSQDKRVGNPGGCSVSPRCKKRHIRTRGRSAAQYGRRTAGGGKVIRSALLARACFLSTFFVVVIHAFSADDRARIHFTVGNLHLYPRLVSYFVPRAGEKLIYTYTLSD